MDDPIWFAPLNVISHFKRLEAELPSEELKSKKFRKAREAFEVAIMLVGIRLSLKREFWLQLVGDEVESPDIRTGTFVSSTRTRADDFSTQDVEVVQYNEYSQENLVKFLKRTKFSDGKAYDSLTTILCYVKKNMHLPPLQELHQDLYKEGIGCPVIIVGKTSSEQETYKIAQINPKIDLVVEFDLIKELKHKKYRGVLSLVRGTNAKFEYRPDKKHYPFEKIGLTYR